MPCQSLFRAMGIACLGAVVACDQPHPAPPLGPALRAGRNQVLDKRVAHVLLLSIDGLHARDLRNYVAAHPASALAQLSHTGTTFSNASTSRPSDSYPGLLAQITGGTPRSTGVY